MQRHMKCTLKYCLFIPVPYNPYPSFLNKSFFFKYEHYCTKGHIHFGLYLKIVLLLQLVNYERNKLIECVFQLHLLWIRFLKQFCIWKDLCLTDISDSNLRTIWVNLLTRVYENKYITSWNGILKSRFNTVYYANIQVNCIKN